MQNHSRSLVFSLRENPFANLKRSLHVFDMKRLEHFLDGLQVETHFPSRVPQIVVEAPRSPLDEKMDKYDLFIQGNFNHNYGTPESPVYGPRPDDSATSPWGSYLWPTYAGINRLGFASNYYAGIAVEEGTDVSPETPYDRLKEKLGRLASSKPVKIADSASAAPSRSPDFVHTLTAWRRWKVNGGMLEALGSESKWEPRRAPRANCRVSSNHAAPHFGCNCGYWSFKTREGLTKALAQYSSTVDVIGQVEIWGRVIECKNGFRSEFAYPKELWLLDEGLDSLSWRYGVPVRRLG